MTAWLDPVDVDDPEYWLLSNLEQRVAEQLDPQHDYFGPYLEYLSRLPDYTRPRIGHETIVSHLGRIKRVFVDCYTRFIEGSGKTVVMAFDTVETDPWRISAVYADPVDESAASHAFHSVRPPAG